MPFYNSCLLVVNPVVVCGDLPWLSPMTEIYHGLPHGGAKSISVAQLVAYHGCGLLVVI